MNRTLKSMSRCMLIDGGCRPELWAHAVDTAAYLHNRSASVRNPDTTPYEVMWSRKPDVRHVRCFGSVCYSMVQKQYRQPYDHSATTEVGIVVGYCMRSGCYKVYLPKKGRVVVRRDVWFDEEWQLRQRTADGSVSAYSNPALPTWSPHILSAAYQMSSIFSRTLFASTQ